MGKVGHVTWVDYTVHDTYGLVARVGVRMESGDKKNCYFKNVEPWAFVHEDATLPDKHWIKKIDSGYQSIFGDPLKKVVTSIPERVNSRSEDEVLTDYVSNHFEADLPMYRKLAMIDGISGYIELPDENEGSEYDVEIYDFSEVKTEINFDGEIEPRVMIGDIEVRMGDESFEKTRKTASQPINVICAYDTYEDDYSVFFYNKYDSIEEPQRIREIVEEKFESEEKYADKEINFHNCPTEKSMATSFIDYTIERDFDLTSGWNWTDFDYEYIINRFSSMQDVSTAKLSPFGRTGRARNDRMQIRGLPAFDMMEGFCDKLTFTNWRSQSLDYVCRQELDIGKVDDVNINEDWKTNPEKLIGYNIVDVGLTVALDDANDIHNFFYEIGDVSSIPIYDTFYEKRLVDGYVLSRRGENEILPSADESEIENAGGYVADAINGRKRNVGVSDLKSLYPSAMITWNISTETIAEDPSDFDEYVKVPKVPEPKEVHGKITEDQIDWDWLYCSLDKEGIIPRTLKKLFKKRNREKEKMYAAETDAEESKWDRKQGATKVIMNSFYGNASSKYWRLSNKYLGDAVTSTARYTLWKGEKTLERIDKGHVYSDTDSHFVELESDTTEEQVEELEWISQEMDDDASEIAEDIGISGKHPFLIESDLHGDEYTCMKWEPEKVYHTFMQLGKKKRYAGSIKWKEGTWYEKPKISISGFEFRRSDSPEITAELQKKVIEKILRGSDFEDVSEYIRDIISEIHEDNDELKKFALPGSINKPLSEYKSKGKIIRGTEYSNEHLGYEFREGDDPFVYHVRKTPSGKPGTDVVAFEWNEQFKDGFLIDEEETIERAIRKPLDSIIGEMDWEFSELRTGKEQQSMELNETGGNPFA